MTDKTSSEKKLVSIGLEITDVGIVIQNADSSIVDFNPAALDLLNLTADQLIGKTSLDSSWRAIHEDESDFPGETHPAIICLKTGEFQKNVVMGIRNAGAKVRWLRVSVAPIFKEGTKLPSQIITSFSDITEQIESQKRTEKDRSDLRFILDSIPHMVAHWSSDLINLESNRVYQIYFEKDPNELRGTHLKDMLGEKLFAANLPHIKRVLEGETVSFDRDLKWKNGETRHTVATYIPNFKNQKVVSFLAIVIDVTEIKNLEKKRQELEVKLVESTRLSALGEMVGGVAHEINNPLAIIRGSASILRKLISKGNPDPTALNKSFDTMNLMIDRIVNIISGLRTYSNQGEPENFEKVNVREVIDATLSLCNEKFKLNGIEMQVDCAEECTIQCRPEKISQLMMNLLNNAFDAMTGVSDKWIHLSVAESQKVVTFQFTDSGTGIDPEIASKIMQPFFTTKGVGKGTGLGLSIAHGIAQAHGGSLIYIPSAAHTTFVLTLPRS